MNTPLKFDYDPLRRDRDPLPVEIEERPKIREKRPRKQPSFRFKRSDHRAYYANLVSQALSSIVRHRKLVASLVVIVLALACSAMPFIPRKYSAEALIYPNLLSSDGGKAVPVASVDASAIVAGEARLIRSDAILRAVATRLGYDLDAAMSHSWMTRGLDQLRATFLPEIGNRSPFDRRVAMLRNKVLVMNDTRSYLISISFSAYSADEAAQVVNAFAIEYLRDKVRQRRLNNVSSAEAELRQQQAIYGEKHPKTMQASAELDAERAALEAAMNPQPGDQEEVANGQGVKLAEPKHTPTSPKGFVILGLSFLLALLAGIGLAIYRDRREAERSQTAGCLPLSK